MSQSKSPRSHRINIGPILNRSTEESVTGETKPPVNVQPTLADCVKYNIDTKHAVVASPEELTKENYILLREKGISVKEIRIMYDFKDHNQYYKAISKFEIRQEETKNIAQVCGIEEKAEFMQLEKEKKNLVHWFKVHR